jgi:hypothetical protein
MLVAGSGSIFAQGDEFTTYENAAFTVNIPGALQVQEESESKVVFAADPLRIEIATVPSLGTPPSMGDGGWAAVMQVVFADSGYEAGTCAEAVTLPCVQFKDMQHSDGALLRAILGDPAGSAYYAITFSALTEQDLMQMQPDTVIASFALLNATASEDVLFNVVSAQAVNVRQCAGTDCALVGTTTAGQTLEVVGVEEKWYLVKWESGTAYVASWLVARGPDVHVDLNEGYSDPNTGCQLKLRTNRGDADLSVAISGDRQGEAWVDVYRPNESAPVTVDAQYDKEFIDTEEPYIHQFYPWGTYWPTGTYQVSVTVGDASSMIAFDINESGEQLLYVNCD